MGAGTLTTLRLTTLFFGSVLLAGPVSAASRYVRAGAGGSADGSDWTNAYTSLPASLTRGDTYYIADGSYGSYDFNDAVSGTTLITIKKATESDHGTDTGWSSAYGDGVAEFSATGTVLVFSSGYWIFDGVTGSGQSGHGFKVTVTGTGDATRGIRFDGGPSITISHTEISANDPCGVADANKQDGIYTTNAAATDVTLSYNYIHDWKRAGILASGVDGWTIEHNYVYRTYSTSGAHGQAIQFGPAAVFDMEIRHNTFKDTHGTGVIVYLDNSFDDIRIHGNLFWHTGETAACGINSTSQAIGSTSGDTATNIKIHGNTFVGMNGRDPQPSGGIDNNGTSTGNETYNNLWYDSIVTFDSAGNDYNAFFASVGDAPSETHGQTGAGDPFQSSATGDFRLAAATNAGTTLTGAYATDILGVTRAVDGTWDRGAYEYNSGESAVKARKAGGSAFGRGARL